jgi:Tol biopolymer transport system component/DNA-binding winged helix-turn-helix (wHTH) protein
MEEITQPARLRRFESFVVDVRSEELRQNGKRIKLPQQSFRILAMLLERPGEVVMRQEIQKELWPNDTVVEFENSINAAIKRLRIALGDSAEQPRYIETLPRRGYRFIGTVQEPDTEAPSQGVPKRLAEGMVNWSWAAAGAAVLGVLLAGWIWRGVGRPSLLSPVEVVPLAGLPGFESAPAFSPDGNQVAFSLRDGDNSGIYTTIAGAEKPLRLTSNPADCCPTWSPDGRQVAFFRRSAEGFNIYAVSALGGTERPLWSAKAMPPPAFTSCRSLDWSPDGKVLAFPDGRGDQIHTWISLLSLVDSTTRHLTSPTSQYVDCGPAFSPDGSAVAFVRSISAGVVEDLYIVPTAGGEPRRLTFDDAWIFGPPVWTPDGRDILFSSRRGGFPSLWRVSASGGIPRPVADAGVMAAFPSISPKGDQLAYQRMTFKDDIWRLNLRDEKSRQGPPEVLISDKGMQTGRAQSSPDGKRIAFESDRLGYSEIWVCDSDGSNCAQLTSLRGIAGAPRWSPDGKYIGFEYRPRDHSEVYLLEMATGLSRLLPTFSGANNGGPNWSRDGKRIYFYSDRGGGPFQTWKINLNGGPPVQVTRNGGVFATESTDGRFLYYSKFEAPGIWKMPVEGGEETRVTNQPAGEDWWNWALVQNGIYFLDSVKHTVPGDANSHHAIVKFFDFAAGKEISICSTDKSNGFGLAVSPDGKSILYSQREVAESSIMLVNNFR